MNKLEKRKFRASSTVLDEILEYQTAEVDAVSGATYSSNGIMEAVADALEQAKIQDASSSDIGIMEAVAAALSTANN